MCAKRTALIAAKRIKPESCTKQTLIKVMRILVINFCNVLPLELAYRRSPRKTSLSVEVTQLFVIVNTALIPGAIVKLNLGSDSEDVIIVPRFKTDKSLVVTQLHNTE